MTWRGLYTGDALPKGFCTAEILLSQDVPKWLTLTKKQTNKKRKTAFKVILSFLTIKALTWFLLVSIFLHYKNLPFYGGRSTEMNFLCMMSMLSYRDRRGALINVRQSSSCQPLADKQKGVDPHIHNMPIGPISPHLQSWEQRTKTMCEPLRLACC